MNEVPILRRGDVIVLETYRDADRERAQKQIDAVKGWFFSYGIHVGIHIENTEVPARVVAIIRND